MRKTAYFIQKSKIAAWPAATKGVISDDFTLAADAHWYEIDMIPRRSSLQSAPQGEWPSRSYEVTAVVFVPDDGPDTEDFCNMALNEELVLLMPRKDGTLRLIGCEEEIIEVSPEGNAGSEATDVMGETVTFQTTMDHKPYIYQGAVTLDIIQVNATIYHWDLPYALQVKGGFGNREIIGWYLNYAAILFDNFGDLVDYWVTFNEPIATYVGHAKGFFAPGLSDEKYARQCIHHLLL